MDRVARRGPLARDPDALKGGTLPKLSTFLSQLKWTLWQKKLKGGTFWDFSTSILSQNSKKIEGGPFEEKNSQKKSRSAEKN